MLRIGRIHDPVSVPERARLAQVQGIFRAAFPAVPEQADQLPHKFARSHELGYQVVLLTAEDGRGRVLGFALAYHFPDAAAGYLDYIASDPSRSARGIGGALYEALREYLGHKGAQGLYMDVPPDEPELVADRALLSTNKRRLAFYERFGAHPIVDTAYEEPAPGQEPGDPPHLVFDGLGRERPLGRTEARRAVRAILVHKYGWKAEHPYVKRVVASFRDDPVHLRAPRYSTEAPSLATSHGRIVPLQVVAGAEHEIHHVHERGYVERPARVSALLRGLEGLPYEQRPAKHHSDDVILAVHDRAFAAYLKAVCQGLGPKELLYPYVFPIRRPEKKPKDRAVRAGYYCIDTFTPLYGGAYAAARAAVDCAVTGAALLRDGQRLVYSLCRPPGHHAERQSFGGFCYFNNAAIAAHQLSLHGRVVLLDLDYHHGNGGQDIFYQRSDVLFVSIHGHPNHAYPYFSGFADERGEGEGAGFNLNLPLPETADTARYFKALEEALAATRRFAPDWLVVSMGFDIMRGDPTGTFALVAKDLGRIGRALGELALPTLVVQEGGYSRANLRSGARAFFGGLLEAW